MRQDIKSVKILSNPEEWQQFKLRLKLIMRELELTARRANLIVLGKDWKPSEIHFTKDIK